MAFRCFIASALFTVLAHAISCSRQPSTPQNTDPRQPSTHQNTEVEWSGSVNGIAGRLFAADPVIKESEYIDLFIELKHVDGPDRVVLIQDPVSFDVRIIDSEGKVVQPILVRSEVLLHPKWAPLLSECYIGYPVTASVKLRNRHEGSHLDITTRIWKLEPGLYTLNGSFKSSLHSIRQWKGREPIWQGKMVFPPIQVEVTSAY